MARNILAFAFRGNISERVLNELDIPDLDKVVISSGEKAIPSFVSGLYLTRYDQILGLGMYGGPDRAELRVEMLATSQFRNQSRDNDLINLPGFLATGPSLKLAHAMGNSYCNLVSYLLAKRLMTERATTKFNFVHIPKSFSIDEVVEVLTAALLTST